MEHTLGHAVTVFMGFFAIMNPIANVPIFLGLTSEDDKQTTATIAFRSLLLAFIIVAIFSAAGGPIKVVVTIAMFALLCVITYGLFRITSINTILPQ